VQLDCPTRGFTALLGLIYGRWILRIRVRYGQDEQAVELNQRNVAGLVYPNEVDAGNELATLRGALSSPVRACSFEEFIGGPGELLVIVNDGARSTPTAQVLDIIGEGISRRSVSFLVATGSHRMPTEEEFSLIFGGHLEQYRARIFCHDSMAEDNMRFMGTSEKGTETWINRRAIDADRLVVIGSVEPHYFAGFTGGRKAFLPGIAAYETIRQNHRLALLPGARPMGLEGNPVHEDMVDSLGAMFEKPIFSIQTVVDRQRRVYAASTGHIQDSFFAMVERSKEVYSASIREKADIVVTAASSSLDTDLYQSQKAIEHGKLALREGGILILVSKCRAGIGPETFYKLLSACKTRREVLERIHNGYMLGYHKAAKFVETGAWADMWAVTDLPDETVSNVFMKPFGHVQDAADEAIRIKGSDSKVLFLMDGSLTVPTIF